LDNAEVQFAKKRIAEIRVPLGVLGLSGGDGVHFQLGIGSDDVALAIPA
jgi:hypothetical protein